MNNLNTITGFYYTYFQLLPQFKSRLECFEYLNAEVCFINGKRMFLNFTDFEIQTNFNNLKTVQVFYNSYFNLLPYFRTQIECFKYVNGLRGKKCAEPLYTDYADFKMNSL